MKVPPLVRMLTFAAILVMAWPLDPVRYVAVCALLAVYSITK